MPEYLAPGVYLEETSYRSKAIEGVSTTTTGLIGPTRFGPTKLEPELITSVTEFEQTYGGGNQLTLGETVVPNYVWHAARAFFAEGGKRLYVSRIFHERSTTDPEVSDAGKAFGSIGGTATAPALKVTARYPGAAGNRRVVFTLRAARNALVIAGGTPRLGAITDRDIVILQRNPPSTTPRFYVARTDGRGGWTFSDGTSATPIELSSLTADDEVRVVTVTVTIEAAPDVAGGMLVYPDLALEPGHTRGGGLDSVFDKFRERADAPQSGRDLPIVVSGDANTGIELAEALVAAESGLAAALLDATSVDTQRSVKIDLENGNDGAPLEAGDYEGDGDANSSVKTGLKQFEDLEDISIVAAPGSTFDYESEGNRDKATTIVSHLIRHAEKMRYRIAVIDSGNNQSPGQVRAMRAKFDSSHAALYYPWVRVLDPVTRQSIVLPPSGFIAGIYARNDVNRAVYKAPANEVVNLALGFELTINSAQQEALNPDGVNCFRFFEGRGNRVWGARTMSSDSEWKYVNLRRYFAYLERSIDRGTQWAVFEPNGELLWASVRRTIEDFLFDEWHAGALLGDKPEKAYFVKCDRSTMTQNDLDNGRMVCLVGVAALRPAEFVIIRIGQWTGERRQ